MEQATPGLDLSPGRSISGAEETQKAEAKRRDMCVWAGGEAGESRTG